MLSLDLITKLLMYLVYKAIVTLSLGLLLGLLVDVLLRINLCQDCINILLS